MFLLTSFLAMVSLAFLLMSLGVSLGQKAKLDREKSSPFECGFTPKFLSRLPFSIRFFTIALIFLIFDVELILIFPIVPAMVGSDLSVLTLALVGLLMILIAGLSHEIFEGSLAWAL